MKVEWNFEVWLQFSLMEGTGKNILDYGDEKKFMSKDINQ